MITGRSLTGRRRTVGPVLIAAALLLPGIAVPSGGSSPAQLRLGGPFPITGGDGNAILDETPTAVAFHESVLVAWTSTPNDPTAREIRGALLSPDDPPRQIAGPFTITGARDGRKDIDPQLVAFGGKVVLLWSRQGDGDDTDIMMTSYDGVRWTRPSAVPASSGNGEDSQPTAAVMDGRLYVAWVTRDPALSPDPEGDVVLQSTGDLRTWSSVTLISPHPGGGQDRDPALAASSASLAITWASRDPSTTGGVDFDIALRTFNGTWGPAADLTPGDGPEDDDVAPALVFVGDDLAIGWEGPGPGGIYDALGRPAGTDTVVRWWRAGRLGPPALLPGPQSVGTDRDLVLAGYSGSAIAVWDSDDSELNGGVMDEDLLIRSLGPPRTDDLVPSFGPLANLTPDNYDSPGHRLFHPGPDRHPALAVAGGRLIVVWETEDEVTGGGGGEGDLVLRTAIDPAFVVEREFWAPPAMSLLAFALFAELLWAGEVLQRRRGDRPVSRTAR